MKMSQLSSFMAQISGEHLHYNHKFILVIEELSQLSGYPN